MTQISRIVICLASAVLVLTAGCSDDEFSTPKIRGSSDGPSTGAPDAGFSDANAGPSDQPLRALCTTGQRRCLFENSPIFEECASDGRRFEIGACEAGQMCRTGRCADFACVPGQTICIGTQTTGVCSEDGRSFRDAQPCPGEGDVCRGGECVDACEAAAREQSYIGCEYLARELPNLYRVASGEDNNAEEAPFAVVVANPDPLLETQVTITTPDGSPAPLLEAIELEPSRPNADDTVVRSAILSGDASEPIESPAYGVSVPPRAAGVFLLDPGNPRTMRAYRVESSRPIIAYQFSPYCCNFTASNDASLLLPTPTLQNRYRVLSYPAMLGEGGDMAAGYLTVVADEDDTRVEVDSPVALYSGTAGFARRPFEGGAIELDRGESITLATAASNDGPQPTDVDLTGAVVTANKDIAVFSGHECTFVPQEDWACDHLEEQVLPATTLGKRYLLTPTREREPQRDNREAVYWRLLADEDSTITFSPALDELDIRQPSNEFSDDCRALIEDGRLELAAGEHCEFGVLAPVAVESTGALVVGGVISGHHSTNNPYYGSAAGDPSFFLAPPVEQFRKNYSFVSPPTFAKTYVAVAVPRGGAVALDGVSIAPESRLELRQVELGNRTWDVYNVPIEPGFHTMESSQKFGIVAYAYDDYVSYAFPGGLDLLPKGSRQ